jgi:hypothetical protein
MSAFTRASTRYGSRARNPEPNTVLSLSSLDSGPGASRRPGMTEEGKRGRRPFGPPPFSFRDRQASSKPWFFSGNVRMRLPVAAKIAFSTAGAATKIVGSPTPPQKSLLGMMIDSTFGISDMRSEP